MNTAQKGATVTRQENGRTITSVCVWRGLGPQQRTEQQQHAIDHVVQVRATISAAGDKLVENIAHLLEQRDMWRTQQLKMERAKEIKIPAKLINADNIRKRKNIAIIDMESMYS